MGSGILSRVAKLKPRASCKQGSGTVQVSDKAGKGKPASEPSKVVPAESPVVADTGSHGVSRAPYLVGQGTSDSGGCWPSPVRHSESKESAGGASTENKEDDNILAMQAQSLEPMKENAEAASEGKGPKQLPESVTLLGRGIATIKTHQGLVSCGSGEVGGLLQKHNVQVLGSGPELIVFSQSFGYKQQIWDVVVRALDWTKYRIVLYDLAGSGSTNINKTFDFSRYGSIYGYADDLLELLPEIGVEPSNGKQCIFVGYGISAMIGLIASVERPQSFKRLILIGASPRYLNAPSYKGGFELCELDLAFSAAQGNYKMWMSGCLPGGVPSGIEPRDVGEFLQPLFSLRPDITLCLLKTLFTADVCDILSLVSVQVHLLHLSHHPGVHLQTLQHLLDNIPNAFAEILPRGKEEALYSQADTLADAIARHMAIAERTCPSHSPLQTKSQRSPISRRQRFFPPRRKGDEGEGSQEDKKNGRSS